MGPSVLIRLTLLLGLVAVCFSKELTSKQIQYFKDHVEEWGAPAIDKVTDGNGEKHRKGIKMSISYVSDDRQKCTARMAKHRDGRQQHGWSCASMPSPVTTEEYDLFDSVSEEEEDIS